MDVSLFNRIPKDHKNKPGPPKVPKRLAQYPKLESLGSIGFIVWGILEVWEDPVLQDAYYSRQPNRTIYLAWKSLWGLWAPLLSLLTQPTD